jgi:heat shock protein HslJ
MKKSLFLFLAIALASVSCHKKSMHTETNAMNASATFDNTRWKLVKLPGIDSLPQLQKDVFIQFKKSDSSYHGNAGCNNFSGKYTLDGTKLILGPAAMTRMMCPQENMKVEDQLSKAIQAVDQYLVTGDHLQLKKGDQVLAEFHALYLR